MTSGLTDRVAPSTDNLPFRGRALMLAHGVRRFASFGPVSALRVSIRCRAYCRAPAPMFLRGSPIARPSGKLSRDRCFSGSLPRKRQTIFIVFHLRLLQGHVLDEPRPGWQDPPSRIHNEFG
jgi:hypothetical protein